MIVVALTGSIGMGKSTTAEMFGDAGIPVWDADATVHKLYGPDGAGTKAIAAFAPEVIDAKGVDRHKLRAAIIEDANLLKQVESVIHPLVARSRADFLANARATGHQMALVDIPLLFEGGGEKHVDQVIVVTAPTDVQRQRVLDRPGMTIEAFDAIRAKQVPDTIKREKADHLIDTSLGMDHARRRVAEIIASIRGD
ncbi:MAG: dephospho-CoA kinase [Pseudomonadota bacterium]